jgi:hypothetical protein
MLRYGGPRTRRYQKASDMYKVSTLRALRDRAQPTLAFYLSWPTGQGRLKQGGIEPSVARTSSESALVSTGNGAPIRS